MCDIETEGSEANEKLKLKEREREEIFSSSHIFFASQSLFPSALGEGEGNF